jgi:signal transduction histidine kinase
MKLRMRLPIRLRVALYVTFSFAVVIIVLSAALTELYEQYSNRAFDVTLQAATSSVANRLVEGTLGRDLSGIREDISETIYPFENKIGMIHIQVFDANLKSVFSFNEGDSLAYKAEPEIFHQRSMGKKFVTIHMQGRRYRTAFENFEIGDSSQGTVIALCSLASLHESTDRIRGLAFIIAPITILLVGIGSVKIARRALRPLERMAHDIDKIEVDTPMMKLPVPKTNDEIEKVADSFNSLMGRIVSLIDSQRNFLMDASHELKTPLTVIQTEIEMLQMKPNLTAEERENLQHLVAEVEYASKLAVDLIYLSRLESAVAVNSAEVDMRPLVQEIVSHHLPIAKRKDVSVSVKGDAGCVVNADRELLSRAISNVLENAIKYSRRGGKVAVTLSADRGSAKAVLSIIDNGAGISADELPRVFDRFYRTRSSRSGDEKGSGLGLSIAKRIVEQQNGRIGIESKPGKGSKVEIVIPLIRLPSS